MDTTTEKLQHIYDTSKTVAIVGLSDNPKRPSYEVALYLQSMGFKIIPVNPNVSEVLGQKSYASLLDIPEKVDIVDIFRRSEYVSEIVDQAIAISAKTIWMQEGISDEVAAKKALEIGLEVVMNMCLMKTHKKLAL